MLTIMSKNNANKQEANCFNIAIEFRTAKPNT